MLNVWQYVGRYRAYLAIFASTSVLASLTAIIVPYYNGKFIDTLVYSREFNDILDFILIIIPLSLVGAISTYIYSLYSIKLLSKSSFDNLSDVVTHIQKIPLDQFLSRFDPAYLTKRITNDIETIYTFLVSNLVSIFLQFAILVASLFMIWAINLELLLVSLLFIPLYVLCYSKLKDPLYERSKVLKEDQSHLYKVVNYELESVYRVKMSAAFDESTSRQFKSFSTYLKTLISLSKLKYLFNSLDGLMSVAFQSVILVAGGILIIEGDMTIGQFTIVNSYFVLTMSSIKYYFNTAKSYQEYKASYSRMSELLSVEMEHNGSIVPEDIQKITLDNVSYTYPNTINAIVNGFTYTFQKGTITLIVGNNGSGKTTLMNVITGIYQNLSEGVVKYSGDDTSGIDLYTTRSCFFSVLIQNTICPDQLVKEYVRGFSNMNLDEIYILIKRLALDGLFLSLNFDIRAHLQKNLRNLSGGERQRVMLLNMLIDCKPVMVLDEPTTGLDDDGINALINYLEIVKLERIIIVISHNSKFESISDDIISVGYGQDAAGYS